MFLFSATDTQLMLKLLNKEEITDEERSRLRQEILLAQPVGILTDITTQTMLIDYDVELIPDKWKESDLLDEFVDRVMGEPMNYDDLIDQDYDPTEEALLDFLIDREAIHRWDESQQVFLKLSEEERNEI